MPIRSHVSARALRVHNRTKSAAAAFVYTRAELLAEHFPFSLPFRVENTKVNIFLSSKRSKEKKNCQIKTYVFLKIDLIYVFPFRDWIPSQHVHVITPEYVDQFVACLQDSFFSRAALMDAVIFATLRGLTLAINQSAFSIFRVLISLVQVFDPAEVCLWLKAYCSRWSSFAETIPCDAFLGLSGTHLVHRQNRCLKCVSLCKASLHWPTAASNLQKSQRKYWESCALMTCVVSHWSTTVFCCPEKENVDVLLFSFHEHCILGGRTEGKTPRSYTKIFLDNSDFFQHYFCWQMESRKKLTENQKRLCWPNFNPKWKFPFGRLFCISQKKRPEEDEIYNWRKEGTLVAEVLPWCGIWSRAAITVKDEISMLWSGLQGVQMSAGRKTLSNKWGHVHLDASLAQNKRLLPVGCLMCQRQMFSSSVPLVAEIWRSSSKVDLVPISVKDQDSHSHVVNSMACPLLIPTSTARSPLVWWQMPMTQCLDLIYICANWRGKTPHPRKSQNRTVLSTKLSTRQSRLDKFRVFLNAN